MSLIFLYFLVHIDNSPYKLYNNRDEAIMQKKLSYSYDKQGDELNIFLGEPEESILAEIEDEIYVRLNPDTKEVLGFTILHFIERCKGKTPFPLPIFGSFSLPRDIVFQD